ncbi:hypothetical protein MYAM1_002820 [Malassezia yamatoensis]|uniref:Tyrosine-protein phosphatase domain-containing protein n=1 Tax=Malassezia yamatoensis TaxID=253288 RepID=A0AAJ5YVK5_9BASI|nr:hypothetical protein MYAM1_002820 [Malassezia yamatoensis]
MSATGVAIRASNVGHTPADAEHRKLNAPNSRVCHPAKSLVMAEPTYGLRHPDLESYAPIDTSDLDTDNVPLHLATAPPVRGINADQYASIYHQYSAVDAPYEAVFPYLYCGHRGPGAQTEFFSQGKTPRAPRYRGLTVIRVSDQKEASNETAPSFQTNLKDSYGISHHHAELLSSQTPEETLQYRTNASGTVAAHDAHFQPQPRTRRANTRNFQVQSLIYTMLSDIVVYSPEGLTDAARATALAFRYAQQQFYQDRMAENLGGLQYNVFLITDSFETLQSKHPELVAIDLYGNPWNSVHFLLREQDEMYRMAVASKVAPNLYLGPSQDFQPNIALPQDAPFEGAPTFSIGLEAFEESNPPTSSFLYKATESFKAFDRQVKEGKRVQVPTAHLECPTGTSHMLGDEQRRVVASDIMNLVAWVQLHVSPDKIQPPSTARRALIYCSDGYTESSVFALSYLMYTQQISLQEAFLRLHVHYNRPFFVFRKDLDLLSVLEKALVNDVTSAPDPQSDWLHDPHFDGSLPSRILPFLYLGNIQHARNARMLKAIGITHVVSVGECVATDPENRSPYSLGEAEADQSISVHNVRNVADDGTDSLREMMCDAVNFIEHARKSGGRVLVHCRVGVSRSSTIVIAYIMAHLDITLIDAYLLVRSRRLNVLIQPHLLFFWELRGWETALAARLGRCVADSKLHLFPLEMELGVGRGRYGLAYADYAPAGKRSVTWSYFCREIAALNARYCIDS